jgi:DNA polymerase I-like protein with 3'-5' exonuclease and polymerase domains
MENAVPLDIPNKVDAELGKSWGDSMEIPTKN